MQPTKAIIIGGLEAGIDVARFGDDETVITLRHGLAVTQIKRLKGKRGYEICDEFENMVGDEIYTVKVDDTGVGGAVTDELHRRNKHIVVPVNNGQNAMNKEKYSNAVNEMWFEFAAIIDTVQLPNDAELAQQLGSRRYKFDTSGRRVIEDRASFKKRFGKSPDMSDSLLLAYYNFRPTAGVFFF